MSRGPGEEPEPEEDRGQYETEILQQQEET